MREEKTRCLICTNIFFFLFLNQQGLCKYLTFSIVKILSQGDPFKLANIQATLTIVHACDIVLFCSGEILWSIKLLTLCSESNSFKLKKKSY